jgi:hypothetical protein
VLVSLLFFKANYQYEKYRLEETLSQQTKLIDFLQEKVENVPKKKKWVSIVLSVKDVKLLMIFFFMKILVKKIHIKICPFAKYMLHYSHCYWVELFTKENSCFAVVLIVIVDIDIIILNIHTYV